MARLLTYAPKNTWIHRLSGVTKMLFFVLWSIAGMLTYDTRVLAVMLAISLLIFKVSKTEWKQVGTVFKFILFFLFLNLITVFLFSPYQGTEIYGTKTVENYDSSYVRKWVERDCEIYRKLGLTEERKNKIYYDNFMAFLNGTGR